MATTLVETATVRRNVITGTRVGIYMNREVEFGFAPTFFGAQVYLNDITGCTERAVETDGYFLFGTPQGPYAFPSELSVLGRGNYWGHTCEEGGFLHGDSPNPSLVKDSHPYGAPVAKSATPPASCF